ncbi:DUF6575 domain-containing protein [Spirulina sp. 06S082]|uniref:DUF6575 domain-containing protein n=1 Tax=Spirulina sp. 06S082 TaxID=3110248 RepID=UPI002B1ED56C|nr:DUF6575 domain-containing protein [Spirulina sp. 06S082]MEA5472001.1 DUF6575 domain-containing protein [Spirulina sp. 06S082]
MSFLPLNTMLGKLEIIKVLDWYDGPRLFIAENASGTRYIAFWADEGENESLWLYSSVSESRIASVISGRFDLRSIYKNAEDGRVFLVHLLHDNNRALVEVLSPEQLDSEILPPEDDYLIPEDGLIENSLAVSGSKLL